MNTETVGPQTDARNPGAPARSSGEAASITSRLAPLTLALATTLATPAHLQIAGRTTALQERLLCVVAALQGSLQRTGRLIARIDREIVPETAPASALREARSMVDLSGAAEKATATGGIRTTHELPTPPEPMDSLQEKLLAVFDTVQGTLQRSDRLIAHIDREIVPEMAPPVRDARRTLNAQTPSRRSSSGDARTS